MNNLERIISIVASVITIANAGLALTGIIEIPNLEIPVVKVPWLIVRVFLFLLMEIIITYFFARLLLKIEALIREADLGLGMLIVIFLWLVAAALSASTSLFNTKWLFISDTNYPERWLVFGIAISNLVYAIHAYSASENDDEIRDGFVAIPGIICHLILFIAVIFLLGVDGFFMSS